MPPLIAELWSMAGRIRYWGPPSTSGGFAFRASSISSYLLAHAANSAGTAGAHTKQQTLHDVECFMCETSSKATGSYPTRREGETISQ